MDHRVRRTGRALTLGVLTVAVGLTVTGAAPGPRPERTASRIVGLADLSTVPAGPSWAPRAADHGGLRTVATARDGRFALHTAAGDRFFLPGVNLGSTTPGYQPGELAIRADDYRAWFTAMDRLGIRAVRIYTIHPPAFYDELAAHNRAHPDRPLYLMQGVYLPDESYVAKGDLYDPGVTDAFAAELRDASAAVSGDLARAPAPGRAGGTWRTDVGRWLAAWVVGVEWDPHATAGTDRRHPAAPAATGRYFRSTPAATPTERWLAHRMDELAAAEAGRGRSMPVAFANWPTTDPLRHPTEPLEQEDLVGVDANHVRPTAQWPGGTFASYHAYPYYPDFQRHEPELQRFRYAGRSDPYAGYLAALRRHHGDIPVMITEFGVPSSVGSAHRGPLGRSQGDHSERQAMGTAAELLRMIHDLGLAGGFLFSWADEWFKLTWNTVAHQRPADRRQLWHDPLTNEQHFGVLATDALGAPDTGPVAVLDDPAARPARRITGRVDEAYLHLRIALAEPRPSAVTVGLDVLPDLSGPPAPGSGDTAADTALVLDLTSGSGRSWIRSQLDPLPLDYRAPIIDRTPAANGWQRFQLVVNRALTVPTTGQRLPAELFDAGLLRHGSWDPTDPQADSRALWRLDGADLVIRVPWALAGFADPSSHQVLVPREPTGTGTAVAATRTSPGVQVSVSTGGVDQRAAALRWDPWQRVHYRERLKPGAAHLRAAYLAVAR